MVSKTIDTILEFFETYVCNLLFFVMCSLIMLQIIFRIAGLPLRWTEEIARYLFVWIIYLAASKAVRQNRHLSVGILPLALKGKARQALSLVTNIITLVFFLVLSYNCYFMLQRMNVRPQFAPASRINMMIPYSAPSFGAVLMTIRCLQNSIEDIRQLFTPSAEGGGSK